MKCFHILFLLIILTSKAQKLETNGVVPLENYYLYRTDDNLKYSDVSYFKDINNHLDKYEGIWLGNYDDKTLELHISQLENVDIYGFGLAFDELLIKYKITDTSSGNEVINTLTYFDDYRYHMKGKYFTNSTTQYLAKYIGLLVDCNQAGTVLIDYINHNTITFWILPDSDLIGGDCPDGNIHIMPTTKATQVTLTKQ